MVGAGNPTAGNLCVRCGQHNRTGDQGHLPVGSGQNQVRSRWGTSQVTVGMAQVFLCPGNVVGGNVAVGWGVVALAEQGWVSVGMVQGGGGRGAQRAWAMATGGITQPSGPG